MLIIYIVPISYFLIDALENHLKNVGVIGHFMYLFSVACSFPQLVVELWGYAGQLCPPSALTIHGVGDQPMEQGLAFLESSDTTTFFLLDPSLMSVLNLARFAVLNFLILMIFLRISTTLIL